MTRVLIIPGNTEDEQREWLADAVVHSLTHDVARIALDVADALLTLSVEPHEPYRSDDDKPFLVLVVPLPEQP